MKPVEFATPNRMQIDTGWREFDRQVGALGLGNVIGGGQQSSYIRPFNELVNPVGTPVAPGYLQDFDLQSFDDLPAEVLAAVRAQAEDESVILYEIHHHNRKGDKVVHGYLLTRTPDDDYTLLAKFYGPQAKSRRVLDVCSEYLANAPTGSRVESTLRGRLSVLAQAR